MDDSDTPPARRASQLTILDREKLYRPGDPHPHVVLTSEELRSAMRVWLRAAVMPRRLWEPFEQQLKAELDPRRPPRRGRDEEVDPRHILVDYIVAQFERAKWRPTREEPAQPFNTPHWEMEGAAVPVPADPPQNTSSTG